MFVPVTILCVYAQRPIRPYAGPAAYKPDYRPLSCSSGAFGHASFGWEGIEGGLEEEEVIVEEESQCPSQPLPPSLPPPSHRDVKPL